MLIIHGESVNVRVLACEVDMDVHVLVCVRAHMPCACVCNGHVRVCVCFACAYCQTEPVRHQRGVALLYTKRRTICQLLLEVWHLKNKTKQKKQNTKMETRRKKQTSAFRI